MLARPPYYRQETDYSCAAACLRMVLEQLGVVKTEAELRTLSDTTTRGTEALQIVNAARQLGFSQTSKNNLIYEELRLLVNQGDFPIVYLRIRFDASAQIQQHAVILLVADDEKVIVLDPVFGEVTYTVEKFNGMWLGMRGLTIIVK